MRELSKMEIAIKDNFYSHPQWYSAEAWAVGRNNTPYRVGYVAYNWWWYVV